MVGVPPPKNCGNLNKVSQSHRKGSSRDVVPAKTAPRGENETKASKPHVPGWEMRRNKVLYYMEDAGGGEEAKSTCPWGDLREFRSRLAPSTSTKALGMGFASRQAQELQEEDKKRASWEHPQHAGHPEVSPCGTKKTSATNAACSEPWCHPGKDLLLSPSAGSSISSQKQCQEKKSCLIPLSPTNQTENKEAA